MGYFDDTKVLIDRASQVFHEILGNDSYAISLMQLRRRLDQPSVLAIAGKVKAGKSSFLNALIGEKVAKVGELETTATINKFVYGKPVNPEKPVKVVWETGDITYETMTFMDSLQANDEDTIKRAEGIAYLEYAIDADVLKEVTLVDTPGTSAAVDGHQKVAEKFFNLRKKHNDQSIDCVNNADAIIYLTGAVANVFDSDFLSHFNSDINRYSSVNSIGVLSKVDIDAALLKRRKEQAEYLADSLSDNLYTVMPVSSEIYFVLKNKSLNLSLLFKIVKEMPDKVFRFFMTQEKFWLYKDESTIYKLYDGVSESAPSYELRKQLKGDVLWSVFRTVCMELRVSRSLDEAIVRLGDIAGIDSLRKLIDEHFFKRSKQIRCASVLRTLLKLAYQLRRNSFVELEEQSSRMSLWIQILGRIKERTSIDEERTQLTAISGFLANYKYNPEKLNELKTTLNECVISPAELLLAELEQTEADYSFLKTIEDIKKYLPEVEYLELKNLFEGNISENDGLDFSNREWHWQELAASARNEKIRSMAQRAAEIYSDLIYN